MYVGKQVTRHCNNLLMQVCVSFQCEHTLIFIVPEILYCHKKSSEQMFPFS